MSSLFQIKQKIIVCILISIYSFALVRPVTPIINDTIAHTFFKLRHMATIHHEHGQYHVHMELQKAWEDINQKNTVPVSLVFETLAMHLQNVIITVPSVQSISLLRTKFTYINFPFTVFLAPPYPPPKP